MAKLQKESGCKVNLLLNILGQRPDGFHELETVLYPIRLFDHLTFERRGTGVELTCTNRDLPVDSQNLVHRAATFFRDRAGIKDGVRLHLDKNIPLAAGLGGGSANAATTLLGLNELFGHPLGPAELTTLAATLGSDVPFFLQTCPALGTGRGEQIRPLNTFTALTGTTFLLIHPGFGIPTAWAYQQLSRFPAAQNGSPGKAEELIRQLQRGAFPSACAGLYNSLEAPALEKYPLLTLFQEFLRANGAAGVLMSGSGSTTFAIMPNKASAEQIRENFKEKFGSTSWLAIVNS